MTVVAFHFENFLQMLVWGALLLLNVWIWQKSKSQSSLLMMIGAGLLTAGQLIWAFTGSETIAGVTIEKYPGDFVVYWMPLIGSALLLVGYYLSVEKLVAANIAALKDKIDSATSGKGDGGKGDGGKDGGDKGDGDG